MQIFKSKKVWVILAVAGVLGVIGYQIVSNSTKIPADQKHTVKRNTLKSQISFSGEVQAKQKSTLSFQTSGLLTSVQVKEGDRVTAGQVLATLDVRQLKKQLQKSLNTYSKTRNDFDQTKDNNYDRIATEPEDVANNLKRIYEKAQFDLNNSVIDVELQDLAMQYSVLVAPIDGIVTNIKEPNSGVNITPVSESFEIINPNTVYFEALIDQTELANVHESMVGDVVLDAFPDNTVSGNVQNISFTPKAGETGTVYQAEVSLLNADISKYRVGMTGDITFTLKERTGVLTIPLRYIKTVADKDFANLLTKKGLVQTEIKTGEEVDGNVEIVSGLQEGNEIVEFPQ